ncbi:TPA: glutamine ABC transporter permease GlnP [Klebsiella michiganensis]|jgi:glutamine transport system permease protein|uniref:glutamine ABC transporter permease GlnP n=1 Tax=Klebsiella TaxID=570 RepID=UPI0007CBCD23|nr:MULTISPECIES: glutamine ABC transporter permease GlnP [Klebsiella]EKV5143538.1 glutamine ABC transporter permease GlnP [Klebsiella michiganensis]EKV5145724.1 glutamine ABC transporter permease GlnP [Klebsiella michiganensis]MBA4427075.1 glutamine ABC transporter permease GlnP [Klebsiella michiganensis]MBW5962792.1 glutamine ABC transporter permease GlnP [Klebsiella michiganensis]MDK3051604.1 glutamine ABC transporter permease GlnP [Klebsiella michiganensis]
MNFETKYIWESLPLLLQGLQLTILISMVGLAGGFIIGLLAGVSRALGGGIAKTLSLIFVELIRGTPIMVQVMFIYFALPMILPVRIDPITAAMVTIIINSGAYIAEITRGAILSINRGFKEASLAMGLSQRATLWHVIMPLALRRMIPALGNQWIISIKDTSLFIVIGVAELTRQGQEIIAGNFRALEVWTAVALIYLAVTLCLSFLLKQLEKRIHIL